MPINIGEVEAVLTAKDNMSQQIALASEKVKQLSADLKTLGQTSGEAFTQLNSRLYSATQELGNLKLAAVEAGRGTDEIKKSSDQAGESISQMDRLATRMIERMVILYALRGAFNFTKDLFEASGALVSMSEKLDVSIAKLQEIQFAAESTGVPFKTAESALDNFDKKLSEMKATTGDALQEIGLSFEKLFAMSPDERINAVTAAIAAMPSQLDRTRAEVALFGSDAIDPLIKRFGELQRSAHENNAVMSDETIHSLAIADAAYKQFWLGLKGYAAGALVNAQDYVAIIMAPFFGGKMDWSGLGHNIMHPLTGGKGDGGDGTQPPDANPNQAGPATGDAFIAQLRNESLAVKDLTMSQRDNLAALKELDMLTVDNAARLGVTTEQYKQYVAGVKEATAAQKLAEKQAEAYAQTWERAEKQVADLWTKDVESFAAAQTAKDKAQMALFGKEQAQEEAFYKHRFDTGQMSEESYQRMRIAIAEQYAGKREILYQDERDQAIANLNAKQEAEHAKVEEEYAQGKLDYEQYQQSLTAIDERYSNLRSTVEANYDAQARQRHLDLIAKEVAATVHATAAIDAQAKSIHTLADEWITVAEAKKKAESGNSITYDLSTPEGMAQFRAMNPAAAINADTSYFKTHTLQQAIAAGRVDLYAGYHGGGGAPGFAEGGTVSVGERGPETVRLPFGSTVFPTGSATGGGASVTIMPGAFVMNYPIMNDARAINEFGKIAGDAILQRMRNMGYNVTRGSNTRFG